MAPWQSESPGEDDLDHDPVEASVALGIRERILMSACALFAEKGFAATSIRDITRAASVTNPMVYYYFSNKENLFVTLLKEATQAVNDGLVEIQAREPDFEAQLLEIVLLHFDLIRRSPDVARIFVFTQFGPERARFEHALNEMHSEHMALWTSIMREGQQKGHIDPDIDLQLVVLQFFGLIQMPMLRFLEGKGDISLDKKTAEQLIRIYFHGTRPSVKEGHDTP